MLQLLLVWNLLELGEDGMGYACPHVPGERGLSASVMLVSRSRWGILEEEAHDQPGRQAHDDAPPLIEGQVLG